MDYHFETSIQQYTPDVWNQEHDFICSAVIITDMVSTVFRIEGITNLVLSPQILVDARCDSQDKCFEIIKDPNRGLQSVNDYPFMFTRNPDETIPYQLGMRYWIDRVNVFHRDGNCSLPDMKLRILQNFSVTGKKYPFVAGLVMGDFLDPCIALAAYDGKPFRPPRHQDMELDKLIEYIEKRNKEVSHCLLIVGVNTTSTNESEHYLLVKNCHGEGWGHQGFSKMAFEALEVIVEPVLEDINMNMAPVEWIPPEN